MTKENIPEHKQQEVSDMAFSDALQELKQEFSVLKQTQQADTKDIALYQLTEKISVLLEGETTRTAEQLNNHPELIELMRQVVRKSQSTTDVYQEAFSLDEEKRLLLDLMYSVLADLGRAEQERTVVGYTEEATSFFTALGVGGLYQFLVQKAK